MTINKNLFDTYLLKKGHKLRNWGNKWVCYSQRQNFSKLSPLAKNNWGNKRVRYN